MKSIEEQAAALFDSLQSPFGYHRTQRDADVKRLSNALVDAGIAAILADNRPIGPEDEAKIVMVVRAIDDGRRRVLLGKLAQLSRCPQSFHLSEITEIANEAISLLTPPPQPREDV